jgi:hypothetical protein
MTVVHAESDQVLNGAAGIPLPPADVARAHQAAWAAALCGSRRTLTLSGTADAVAALRRALDDQSMRWEAVAWLDGLEIASSLDSAVEVLRDAVGQGLLVLVVVPNTRLSDPLTFAPARSRGWDDARSMADALRARIVPQYLAEGSLIGPSSSEEAETLTGRLLAHEGSEPDDAHAWLLVANAPEDALSAAEASLRMAGARLQFTQLAALEAANAELRRANARLARERLGKHDSAAASVIGPLEARVRTAEAAAADLERRLEIEKQVAIQNDELFQQARRQLGSPRYKAVDRLRARLIKIPGMRRLGTAVLRRLAR